MSGQIPELLHALIVEDCELDCALLIRAFNQGGYEVDYQRVESAIDLQAALDERKWDCVISDYSLPGFSGISALKIVREHDPDLPFIFVSGTIGEEVAVEALRFGAQDFVTKGNLARLAPAARRELADAELRRAHRRTEQKVRQLEKFEAIGQLAGGVAHDFNNVIGAIMGWAELGEEEVPPGTRAHKFFLNIRDQSQRAANLTRQLLAYARRQVLTPRNMNVNHTVTEAMDLLRRIIGEQIEIKTVLAADLRSCMADSTQIEQVLVNLSLNARDAMPDGGRLVIETHNVHLDEADCRRNYSISPGDYVELSVSDTGTGMDPATMDRMFEPFFTTKEKGKGTGLGLPTALGIVKQHLGYIDVHSELGKGTLFRVYLPASQGSPDHPDELEQTPLRGGAETILVAEDHDGLRQMSHQILSSLGYSIILARDGRDAVEQFEANAARISLLVLDVVMPRLSGPAALARIRGINPGIPAIFTSGYSEESDVLNTLISRGDALLLQKPYPPSDLAKKIRELLDKTARPRQERLHMSQP